MGVEGIGASVVRKEDRRFITGKGRYVDDIKLPGMTFAHFIRSPYAHAKVKSIDASAAMDMPGVVAVLTGQQIVDDKVGNLICGWAITSKDGSPMNGALCGAGGSGCDRRDQEPGQGRGRSCHRRL
jgi:carbon-monoxide dehydrogenase large subunit